MASTKGDSQNAIAKLTFQPDHFVGVGQVPTASGAALPLEIAVIGIIIASAASAHPVLKVIIVQTPNPAPIFGTPGPNARDICVFPF